MPHRERPQDQPPRKPSNWWALEREPWKRIGAEIAAREKAEADRERADRALRSAFAFAGAGERRRARAAGPGMTAGR